MKLYQIEIINLIKGKNKRKSTNIFQNAFVDLHRINR